MGQMIKDHSKNKNKIIIIKNKYNKARRKEMFYLMMHSTHFIYGYMEWMNECLTTPQHEKHIGYWVSEKGWLYGVRHYGKGPLR